MQSKKLLLTNQLLGSLINQLDQMSVMLVAKISHTLAKNMPYGNRFCITKKLQFSMELITKLKCHPFHIKPSL